MLYMKHVISPRKIMTLTLGALTLGALIVLSFGISAPANDQRTYDGMTTQESIHVPDTKLRLFIDAQKTVNNVQEQYQQAAENPASKAAGTLQRSMGEEIIRTIKAHGLTVDEYNNILAEIQKTDTSTARRYHDMTRTE